MCRFYNSGKCFVELLSSFKHLTLLLLIQNLIVMRTFNPTVNDILNKYFNFGICIITLKNEKIIVGNFAHLPITKSGEITYWQFIPLKEQPIMKLLNSQIEIIERPD
jgi:hypothetical protein